MGSQRVGHNWATDTHTQPLNCQGSPLLMLFMQGSLHPFHSPSTRRKFPTSSYVASPFPGAWVASSQLCLGCFAFLLFHEPSLITHGMAHVWTTYLGTPEKNQGEREVRKSNKNKEKVKASRKWRGEEKKQKSYFLLICFMFLCQFINSHLADWTNQYFMNTLSQPGYRFLHWGGTEKALKAGKNHMGTCVISKMVFYEWVLPMAWSR